MPCCLHQWRMLSPPHRNSPFLLSHCCQMCSSCKLQRPVGFPSWDFSLWEIPPMILPTNFPEEGPQRLLRKLKPRVCLRTSVQCILWGFNKQWVYCPFLPQIGFSSAQFSSVAQSCLTVCNPMDCSTPGLLVHHQLPEFTQTHVHRVGDAIQSFHYLSSSSSPSFNLSQHQGIFQ